jgi:hypothetical protein
MLTRNNFKFATIQSHEKHAFHRFLLLDHIDFALHRTFKITARLITGFLLLLRTAIRLICVRMKFVYSLRKPLFESETIALCLG